MKTSIFFLLFALCITLSAASIPSTIAEEKFTATAKKLTSSVHTGKPYGGRGYGRGQNDSDSDSDDDSRGRGAVIITRRPGNRCGAAHSSLRRICRTCNRGCVRRFGSDISKGFVHAMTMNSAVHTGSNWRGRYDGTDDEGKGRGKGFKRQCRTRQCRVCRRACRRTLGRRTVIVKHKYVGGNRGGYKH